MAPSSDLYPVARAIAPDSDRPIRTYASPMARWSNRPANDGRLPATIAEMADVVSELLAYVRFAPDAGRMSDVIARADDVLERAELA